ncbi:MAG: hypothetical protein FJ011_21905 [Chloroflexi bacterium]|nr:hypothetical protein [Chloroflexota bacterium]
MKLHDWFFERVNEACYDRDYLYLAFVRHFTAFMADIIRLGKTEERGDYLIPGIKSGLDVRLVWQLQRRLDWIGPNVLTVQCQLVDRATGDPQGGSVGRFDLSTGEMVL